MTTQSSFVLRGRNPDILTCIANLSNDEVFTPPELANRMLDTLADTWAANNNGANIWADKTVTFLDPCTKSGVFLREITSRLTDGLKDVIPDLQERVNHILTKQVFGIAITQITSQLARRSVYCSKLANGEHSIVSSFTDEAGHIWFERTEHTWEGSKCRYCGANQRDYDRGSELESHAYAFIHSEDPSKRLAELFGGEMQFDVVIGNPPYQLGQSGGEAVGGFAMPIYQEFVRAAKRLDPKFVIMITPSRWFAGGRGLDEYRSEMLTDRRLRVIVDFPTASDVFPGVDIKGGVSYFVWDGAWNGECAIKTFSEGSYKAEMVRALNEWDVLIRRNEAVSILRKVEHARAREGLGQLSSSVSPIQPFGLRTNFRGSDTKAGMKRAVVLYQNGGTSFIKRQDIPRNDAWIDQWKVLIVRASGSGNDPQVLSRPIVAPPGSACTETYLVLGRCDDEMQARNLAVYLRTRFVRFLVSLRKNTQDVYNDRFMFVPDLPMDREWTDKELYKKYKLTKEEIEYIESMIRPMEGDDD